MQEEANQIAGPYFKWHYSRGLKELLNVLENFQRFIFHFFSIKLLVRTLFSPWRRLHEEYDKKDIANLTSSFLVNSIMRLVGAVSRLVIILVGLFIAIMVLILSAILLVAWLFFPFLVLAVLSSGAVLIISAV